MKELPPQTTRLTEIHSDARKSRLAARLRDNLLRRKHQSRNRDAGEGGAAGGPEGRDDGPDSGAGDSGGGE